MASSTDAKLAMQSCSQSTFGVTLHESWANFVQAFDANIYVLSFLQATLPKYQEEYKKNIEVNFGFLQTMHKLSCSINIGLYELE